MNPVRILICLTLLLSGCGQAVVVKREIIPESPPAALLQDCERPAFQGRTYGDAVLFIPVLVAALGQCTAEKRALRQWSRLRGDDGEK